MQNNRFSDTLQTRFFLDGQMEIVRIENFDSRLFFGKSPLPGKKLTELLGEGNPRQVKILLEGIRRACREKRNTCFEYRSVCTGGSGTYVGAYVEYRNEDSLTLSLSGLESSGAPCMPDNASRKQDDMLKIVYENLPIGVEIYDRDGRLIEMNPHELQVMGIHEKKDVLGINLFENPNLPDGIRKRLLAGESLHFSTDYDFNRVKGYYKSSKKSVRYLEVSVSVMKDETGAIDKYLVISQDISDRVRLRKKYENLYYQNKAILDSLPVGVGLYDSNGTMLYINDTMCRIFNIDMRKIEVNPINLHRSPVLPKEVKNAIHDGVPVHTYFPYDFNMPVKGAPDNSPDADIRQIECNGRPLFNAAGKVENYVFIINDVTETARNQEALRQSKRKSELAMQNSDIMLWEFDVCNRLFYSDNEPLNDYDRAKPLTILDYTDSIHADDREQVRTVIERMCIGENFTFTVEVRILFPGSPVWQYCSINGSPYEMASDGRVVKYVGTRKNNTELQKKKQLQEKILNSIPLSIHIKDVEDNFRYAFCNDESKRMFGTSEEKTTYDVMTVEEVERIQKTDLEVFNTGKPYLGLERVILKDGRSYDTIVRKSIIEDNGKRLLLNTRWDQSLQIELMRRAKVLSITMEAMDAYTWFYEPGKNRVSFGEGFDKTCQNGSKVNSLEKFAASVHPDDRQRFIDTMKTLLMQENGEWNVEYRADLNDDGVYEWWQTRGILETTLLNDAPYRYMFGMSISIEAHKQAELALLKNKEELKNLIRQNELVLNNTNSGLAYITRDYIVQWENISMCSQSLSHQAYKKGELCYKSAHNRNKPCENCVLQRAVRSRQVEQIKFSLDSSHIVEIFASPVLCNDGSVDGIVIRMDDVTERERMIEELRQAKLQSEQSDKLKSAFLANMSHEIRTPLNAIVGFSELLISSDGEEREEYIRIINNNNELLLKLINDILDLSKIEAGSVELKYEEFDLSEYFNGMAASMKQRITNPNVRLIAVNPCKSCRVSLDRNRVAQILTNYVTNAIKYTPKGFIEMGYEYGEESIRLYVKDSGIGIPEVKKDKVFHRFEKLDEFAQGTGLGLSICKAIAMSMGGNVGFDSRYGEGSLFWAELPCKPEIEATAELQGRNDHEMSMHVAPSVAAVRYRESSISPDRKTILVAEDIPSNFLLVSALLHKQYDLVHALNGRQAVDLVRDNQFDLLLMDMKMPVMDGLTATAEIRKFNRDLPIVALTAHAFEADRLAAMNTGCNDYLVKPIDKSRLMAVLHKYCFETEASCSS